MTSHPNGICHYAKATKLLKPVMGVYWGRANVNLSQEIRRKNKKSSLWTSAQIGEEPNLNCFCFEW